MKEVPQYWNLRGCQQNPYRIKTVLRRTCSSVGRCHCLPFESEYLLQIFVSPLLGGPITLKVDILERIYLGFIRQA